jgi:DNA-binding phage protein
VKAKDIKVKSPLNPIFDFVLSFRQALFQEAAKVLLEGNLASGRSALRDHINATMGFDALAKVTKTPAKSLMRVFGPKGNPTAANLFAVIDALQDKTGVWLEVRAVSRADMRKVALAEIKVPILRFRRGD